MSSVSRIPLEMSGIPFVVLSLPSCGEHISWMARTGQPNLVQINGKIWGRLLISCYKYVSQYFLTGKFVVLDIVFCVSKGITTLLEFGVYADAFIKKCKYWPKGVPGDTIEQYFSNKDVTYVDMFEAITEYGSEGKAFKNFFFK